MRSIIELAAYKPEIPLLIASLLYVWIAVGSFLIKKPLFAGMWMCYAIANAFMLLEYIKK